MNFLWIVFNFVWCKSEPMDIYPVDPKTILVAVCYNAGNLNLFRVRVDVTLLDLKDQLDQINWRLNHRDTRRVDDVGYRRPSIDSAGILQFGQMMLKNDNDERSMFSIFGQHNMFSMVELDASLLTSSKDILKSLIQVYED